MRDTFINKIGGRTVHFLTSCGLKILLDAQPGEPLLISCTFEERPVSFVNSGYRLSKDGAQQLAFEIERLYGDSDDVFRSTLG